MKKHVYVANTGGTIGMRKTADGYAPEPGHLAAQMAEMPVLKHPMMPRYTIREYSPLLDSSNMTPEDWLVIAEDIAENYDRYDGFIVIHGTDTMAYTASALPFMLQELRKPVILTGSQIPLCEVRNDARENLITSLLLAAEYGIPEVCIYFGNKLLRGCRSVKVHATGFQAFHSPNFPPLGTVGINIDISWEHVLPMPENEKLTVRHVRSTPTVAALRLFPGMSPVMVETILRTPLKGLVLETFGVGNAPDANAEFLDVLREATKRGVVIVACTQCLLGTVGLGEYKTGASLLKAGVISGFDMTAEAALAKLFYLFSRDCSPEEVKAYMQQNLRGEITIPHGFHQ